MGDAVLDISSALHCGVAEIQLRGEVDLSSVSLVRDALRCALTSGCRSIVVDAGELTYLDSSGLNCLVAAAADAEKAGIVLMMRNPTKVVRRVLEITALDTLLLEQSGENGSAKTQ